MGHYASEMRPSMSGDWRECLDCDYDGYTESYKNEKTRCDTCKGIGHIPKSKEESS